MAGIVGEVEGDQVMWNLKFVIRTLDFTLRKMKSHWNVCSRLAC